MNDIVIIKETTETPTIIVCDLGVLDWLELADGIVLIDYRYLAELQRKYEG